jgi:hypothetical protein
MITLQAYPVEHHCGADGQSRERPSFWQKDDSAVWPPLLYERPMPALEATCVVREDRPIPLGRVSNLLLIAGAGGAVVPS